jgi:putative PIN family toxin of toxin-antitoxin system
LKLILDTNVVLDWLVFRDATVADLQSALDSGRVEIVTHAPAVDELRRVLAYSRFELAAHEQQEMLARYDSQTRRVTLPAELGGLPAGFPRCRDRDDQHFLTLAYFEPAALLVSKDAAILELTRRVQKFGITVLDPRQLAATLAGQ